MTKKLLYVVVMITALALSRYSVAAADSDEEQYFAVYVEGKKVGYAVQSRVVSSRFVTTTEEIRVNINRMGTPIAMEAGETCVETTTGEPVRFTTRQRIGAVLTRMSGRIDRQRNITITARSMGTLQRYEQVLPEGVVMAEGLRQLTLENGLNEGAVYEAVVYSPLALQIAATQIKVGMKTKIDLFGRIADAVEIKTTTTLPQAGTIVSTSYVDDQLRVLKDSTPFEGIIIDMVACAKEFAMGKNSVVELIDKMFLPSPRALDNLDKLTSVTYYLAPKQYNRHLKVPTTGNQRVNELQDGRVAVTVEVVMGTCEEKIPYVGPDEEVLAATKPTRYLQSDHELVIALAKRAIGDTTNALDVSKKIEAFTADYIESRSLSIGYASAGEVAASKQGDCSEFAILTAAMCRAVGLPARVVVGVVYVNDHIEKKGFRAHLWTQAYVGDQWIILDAALTKIGRKGHDASHIALAVGDGEPEEFFALEATLAKFEIENIVINDD